MKSEDGCIRPKTYEEKTKEEIYDELCWEKEQTKVFREDNNNLNMSIRKLDEDLTVLTKAMQILFERNMFR